LSDAFSFAEGERILIFFRQFDAKILALYSENDAEIIVESIENDAIDNYVPEIV